jgi:hypothetical protein
VVNKSRRRQVFGDDGRPLPATSNALVGNTLQLVGDDTNPILKPNAAEVVKKHGEISLSGVAYPTPSNQCWPGGVPYIFRNFGMQMLQEPNKITILYPSYEFRQVSMNVPHPAQVTPSWNGDAVGYYEGDELVIDTVGVKIGPFAMVDEYGTPHTEALHVVARYRCLNLKLLKNFGNGTQKRISVSPLLISDRKLTQPIRARYCSSNSRSRMKVFSRHRGRRLSLIGRTAGIRLYREHA